MGSSEAQHRGGCDDERTEISQTKMALRLSNPALAGRIPVGDPGRDGDRLRAQRTALGDRASRVVVDEDDAWRPHRRSDARDWRVVRTRPSGPGLVWGARERSRPLGLGGFLLGLGVGAAGLLALASAQCAAFNSSGPDFESGCIVPDVTP